MKNLKINLKSVAGKELQFQKFDSQSNAQFFQLTEELLTVGRAQCEISCFGQPQLHRQLLSKFCRFLHVFFLMEYSCQTLLRTTQINARTFLRMTLCVLRKKKTII